MVSVLVGCWKIILPTKVTKKQKQSSNGKVELNCTCKSDGSLCESVPIIAKVTTTNCCQGCCQGNIFSAHFNKTKRDCVLSQSKKNGNLILKLYFLNEFPIEKDDSTVSQVSTKKTEEEIDLYAYVEWASDKLFIITKQKNLELFLFNFHQREIIINTQNTLHKETQQKRRIFTNFFLFCFSIDVTHMMAMWKIFLYILWVFYFCLRAQFQFWGQMGVHENNQLIEVRKMRQTCGNIIIVDSDSISDCLYYWKSAICLVIQFIFSMRKFLFCCARILGVIFVVFIKGVQ